MNLNKGIKGMLNLIKTEKSEAGANSKFIEDLRAKIQKQLARDELIKIPGCLLTKEVNALVESEKGLSIYPGIFSWALTNRINTKINSEKISDIKIVCRFEPDKTMGKIVYMNYFDMKDGHEFFQAQLSAGNSKAKNFELYRIQMEVDGQIIPVLTLPL